MKSNKRLILLVLTVFSVCSIMILIESVFQPVYAVKSLCKVILFLGIVFLYLKLVNNTFKPTVLQRKKATELKRVALLSGIVYLLILLLYFLLANYIDTVQIKESLMRKEGIDKQSFIFIAIYISLINSFLEEYFFRGFIFQQLKQLGFQRFAYIFSATAFAIYHVGIISRWFSVPMFVLISAALFLAGIALNVFCHYTESVLGSWVIHVSANLAINTIGFMIL